MKKLIAIFAASLLSIGAVMAADAAPAAKDAQASEAVVEEGVAVDTNGDAVETETIIEDEDTDGDNQAAPAADEKGQDAASKADEKKDTDAK